MSSKILWGVFTCLLTLLSACSDESSSFNASDVCPVDGYNAYGMPNRGTFVDERDGRVYSYTTIGDQVWMAQSLNYDAAGSFCYDSLSENCEKYGKLYRGENLDQLCPAGWRMPKVNDYEKLMAAVDNKMEVLAAGYWEHENEIVDTLSLNECGLSLRAGGFAYATEHRNKNRDVSFWTDELDDRYENEDYFKTFYVCYKYTNLSGSQWIETMKYYVRCIKE